MNQVQMAAALGVSQTFMSSVEIGKSLPSAQLAAGVERMGFSSNYLMTGEGKMQRGEESATVVRDGPLNTRPLRILGRVPAGGPGVSPVEELVEGYFPVPWELAGDRDAFCLRVEGESMVGALEPGDLVVVSPALRTRVKDGDLVVVRIEPDATYVKRWMTDRRKVFLMSANPKFPPILLGGDREVTVIGKVVCAIHKYR
jgi:SOS-response transcriptional repressor LexA